MKLHATPRVPWARPSFGDAERQAVIDCMADGVWLSGGPRVERFERAMATRVRRRFAVATNSGSAALDIALRAVGVRRDDRVVMPALGRVATASAIARVGAVPVFADVDRRSLGLSAARAEERVDARVRAVVCADLGGSPCDYGQLSDLSQRTGLPLIVDGAHSVGSAFGGRPTLSCGLVATLSLHATRTMSTVEGGMAFTDDPEIDHRLRRLRALVHHRDDAVHRAEPGNNLAMTELQAAIGLQQLHRLDDLLADRQRAARRYAELLDGAGLDVPAGLPGGHDGRSLFTVLVPHRDAVIGRLARLGIEARACHPAPLYHQAIFTGIGAHDCPVAEWAGASILNPPMFHGITADEQERVVSALRAAIADLSTVRLRKAV